jgi:predicted Zn-dependent protease
VVTVAVVASVLALALAFHRSFEGILAVPLYGGLAIGACLLGKRKMPQRIQPAHEDAHDALDALLGSSSDYRKGERVLCLLPGEPFLHIAEVKACREKQVEVTAPDGETHVLRQRDVAPYEVAVQQRVLASRAKLKTYLPAVITHIKDETFAVRFDDGEVATCSLKGVWFLCRREVLRVGPAKCQAMLETVDAAMAEARKACEEGNHVQAHEVLDRALGRHPFDPTLHLGQAMAFEREGKFAEAAAEAYEAIRDVSSDPVPYTILGNAYLKMERYVEAEEAFRAALNLAPDRAVHWQNVGRALLKQGEEARAGSFFSRAKLRADLAA